jgi:hypothetical protein
MHTVELLFDQDLESSVRALWARLHDAGLPSLATHTHPTNRPHLTVISAASLTGLPPLKLPQTAELGPVRLLGRAVVREVRPTPELRDLYHQVWTSLMGADPWPPPAEWIPHVSLALRVHPDQHEAVLDALGDLPPARGSFAAARSYDSGTRTVIGL